MVSSNPFVSGQVDGHDLMVRDVNDRLARVKQFDLQQCEQALLVSGLQLSVRRAIEVRRRKLGGK